MVLFFLELMWHLTGSVVYLLLPQASVTCLLVFPVPNLCFLCAARWALDRHELCMRRDASGIGMASWLMQAGRPIAFDSKCLSPAEQKYHLGEQELLAVNRALELWR